MPGAKRLQSKTRASSLRRASNLAKTARPVKQTALERAVLLTYPPEAAWGGPYGSSGWRQQVAALQQAAFRCGDPLRILAAGLLGIFPAVDSSSMFFFVIEL
jgi:hypothetical protein